MAENLDPSRFCVLCLSGEHVSDHRATTPAVPSTSDEDAETPYEVLRALSDSAKAADKRNIAHDAAWQMWLAKMQEFDGNEGPALTAVIDAALDAAYPDPDAVLVDLDAANHDLAAARAEIAAQAATITELRAENAQTGAELARFATEGRWVTQRGRDFADIEDGALRNVAEADKGVIAWNVTRQVWEGPWEPKYATFEEAKAALQACYREMRGPVQAVEETTE